MPDAQMSAAKGNKRDSGYERDPHDWYVEDRESAAAMFRHIHNGERTIWHDPCCGAGNILRVAADLGIAMTGADLIDRANGKYPVRDYLTDTASYDGIFTNPPFRLAVPIVRHALNHVATGGPVVIMAQAKFLYSQGRYPLFTMPECERIVIFSHRPSMPPGEMLEREGESCRGGGFHDFFAAVWRVGKTKPGAVIEWANW